MAATLGALSQSEHDRVAEPGPAHEAVVRAYHARSKHALQRYAAGPETLDWDAQPDPFRRYGGAASLPLPLAGAEADAAGPVWPALFAPGAVPPRPFDLAGIGRLFELSFALAAWKQHGPDRWAVRINPSSGNLHPTEAYLRSEGIDGLPDGLYHYAPRDHALAQRAVPPGTLAGGADTAAPTPRLWLGLSSIHWREAWKYGERAFRYCQLDLGHALGAIAYAAATLGWRARTLAGVDAATVAAQLGLDRDGDFPAGAEREEPECLLELRPAPGLQPQAAPPPWPAGTRWTGAANRLDRHPMYRWPVIDEVARASRDEAPVSVPPDDRADAAVPPAGRGDKPAAAGPASAPLATPSDAPAAATVIRRRRSAQRFDARATMPRPVFDRLLQALQPPALPWDVAIDPTAHLHLLLFAHRVDGLAPGAYVLPRSARGDALLRETLDPSLAFSPVAGSPVPLFQLAANAALAGTLRTVNCHQALGSDAMLAVSMLAEFDAPLPYRARLREAGLAGQVLYLEAEAAGLRGTGIGCFFDDALHQLVGLRTPRLQAVYHFTVGRALDDPRVLTEPPYGPRRAAPLSAEPPP